MERIWLKNYPKGVAADANLEHHRTIKELIENNLARFSQNTAYGCMGQALTFGQLDELSARFGAWLQSKGLAKGARIALMMPNVLSYPVCVFGALRAGYAVVNVNPLFTPRELEYQLNDSGAEAIVILTNFSHTLQQIVAKTSLRLIVFASTGNPAARGDGAAQIGEPLASAFSSLRPFVLECALEDAASVTLHDPAIDPEDVAFLQYTGGTTGVSKGAMLTHRNITAVVAQTSAFIGPPLGDAVNGKISIITALPLYHIFALVLNCFCMLEFGGKSILIPNPRDMDGFMKTLRENPFQMISGVNTLFNGMLNHPQFANLDFSMLKATIGAGMAVQRATAEQWTKATGCTLIEGYGLTETSATVCVNPLDLAEYNGSVGLPISSTWVSIRNDDNEEVPPGRPGEVCIKGPQVMAGYWNNPEETAGAMTQDGYFRSGDMGTMDEQGYVRIVDRKKDMINVSGFNVYPSELEQVVSMHPGVLEAAAIGVPDERSGEAVKLFVVKRDSTLTEQGLRDFYGGQLTGYKRPKFIEFREALPKSNVGKILRKELRRLWEEPPPQS